MTQSLPHIISIGEPLIEISQNQQIARVGVGGDTLNFAIYAKRLLGDACDVSYCTALGDDHLTGNITDLMAAENIKQDGIEVITQQSTGLYAIANLPNGEKIFSYWRSDAPVRKLFRHENRAKVRAYLMQGDVIYFSAISLAVFYAEDIGYFFELMAELKQQGKRIIFDTNYRPNLWKNHKDVPAIYHQAMLLSDIILPSVEDMEKLLSCDVLAIKTHLSQYQHAMIALKNSEYDMLMMEHGEWHESTIEQVRQVVDTTAAGDSFNAGFVASHLQGGSMVDAGEIGKKISACVISHKGAIIPLDAMQNVIAALRAQKNN